MGSLPRLSWTLQAVQALVLVCMGVMLVGRAYGAPEKVYEVAAPYTAKHKVQPQTSEPVFLPPPGFEELMQPVEVPVDIHLDGIRIGAARARIRPGSLTFEDPDQIVQMIGGLTERELVRRALSGELDSNEAYACNALSRRQCGALEPDVAAIVFRPDRFIVEIILAPGIVEPQLDTQIPFTPTPRSIVLGVDAVSSVSFESETSDFSVNLLGSLGAGPLVFTGDVTLNNAIDGARVNNLLARRFYERRTLSAGLINDIESTAFSLPRFMGLRWGPREDLRQVRSLEGLPPIQVNLDGQGRVEIFDGEILVDVQTFDGGIASVDPRNLPVGANDLTFRITDSSGQRTETRFVARGGGLPDYGPPVLRLEGGVLFDQSLADSSQFLGAGLGQGFARVSTSYRLRSDLGITGSVIAASDVGVIDAGLTWRRARHELRFASRVSDEGEQGYRISATTRISRASLSASLTKVDRPALSPSSAGDYLPSAFSGLTFNASAPIGRGNLVAFASTRRSPGADTQYNWQAQYNAPFRYSGPGQAGFWSASISGQNDRLSLRVAVRLQFGARSAAAIRHTVITEARYQDDGQALGARAQLNSSYQRERSAASRETYASRLQIDDRDVRADLNAQIVRPTYRAELELAGTHRARPDLLTRFQSGMAIAERTAIAETGGHGSGVLVTLDADAEDLSADIIVDRRRFGAIEAGETRFVPVRAFRTAEVSIVPRDSAWVQYNAATDDVRLWPGGIASVSREFQTVRTVFGRVLNARAEPVANALVLDAQGDVRTDDQGWFQADIAGDQLRFVLPAGNVCEVRVDPVRANTRVVDLGTRVCRSVQTPSAETPGGASMASRSASITPVVIGF